MSSYLTKLYLKRFLFLPPTPHPFMVFIHLAFPIQQYVGYVDLGVLMFSVWAQEGSFCLVVVFWHFGHFQFLTLWCKDLESMALAEVSSISAMVKKTSSPGFPYLRCNALTFSAQIMGRCRDWGAFVSESLCGICSLNWENPLVFLVWWSCFT